MPQWIKIRRPNCDLNNTRLFIVFSSTYKYGIGSHAADLPKYCSYANIGKLIYKWCDVPTEWNSLSRCMAGDCGFPESFSPAV
jgi:hypothetical protein